MKKLYYDENFVCAPPTDRTEDSENERRRQLSIETNRRRREMAIKVKKEIEKEEKRRRDILKQRRDYQNSLNDKIHRRSAQRSGPIASVQQLTTVDLDSTLNILRKTTSSSNIRERTQSSEDITRYSKRVESAWTDTREICASPMQKYSGFESTSKPRNNEHYLKTFETKLIEQEEAFRQRQTVEMNKFSKILNETVLEDMDEKKIDLFDEKLTYRMYTQDYNNTENFVEYVNDDCNMEHSLEVIAKDEQGKECAISSINSKSPRGHIVEIPSKLSKVVQKDKIDVDSIENINQPSVSSPVLENQSNRDSLHGKLEYNKVLQSASPCSRTSNTIKSILKKGLNNKFGSNPDIVALGKSIDIRDSVEVARTRSSKLFRSSSFTTGLNDNQEKHINPTNDNFDEDVTKKFVRFADDSLKNSEATNLPISKVTINQELNKVSTVSKVQKFTIPGSTPLKPPLHPRSVQEGSYLQASIKKAPVYQPPTRPRKITAETLDKQFEPIMHSKRPSTFSTQVQEVNDDKQDNNIWDISVEKTPTEKEIEQLWAEVRECLSKSKSPSKPESLGPVSGRTIDSSSDVSVRSAPAWQRAHQIAAPFQVRHHRPWSGRQVPYPGQESPLKNEVTIHNHGRITPSVVTQQPLQVISQRDHGFQAVSESLEEFLSLEGSCTSSDRNILNSTTHPSSTAVFLPRPPSQSRIRSQPIRYQINNQPFKYNEKIKCNPHVQEIIHVPKTQLSMDEDKVKQSLDRLNDRLKNMTTFV